jgi:hypothetical protein
MLQKSRSRDSALSWPRHAPPADVPRLDHDRMGNPYLIALGQSSPSVVQWETSRRDEK